MGKFDWKAVVKTVAPGLATALGGPLAGMAVKTIGDKILGKSDATEDEVSLALQTGGPELLLKLKEADYEFKTAMADAGIKLEEIAAADRASARKRETDTHDSWTPRVLAALVICAFFYCVISVMSGHVPNLNDPIIAGTAGTLIGYTSAKADQIVSYYFGSSASSKAKDQTISDIAKME